MEISQSRRNRRKHIYSMPMQPFSKETCFSQKAPYNICIPQVPNKRQCSSELLVIFTPHWVYFHPRRGRGSLHNKVISGKTPRASIQPMIKLLYLQQSIFLCESVIWSRQQGCQPSQVLDSIHVHLAWTEFQKERTKLKCMKKAM